jgi:hypothetical protein
MPWNSNEYTGWEELSRELYPYVNSDTIRAELDSVNLVSVSEMDRRLYFLEIVPDANGNYFWIDRDGDWSFFQEVYIKR